ncbi:tail assembly chaperone [Pseudogracilibacillus auburnensis]|uniref:tail assembly chaperone n=1 Tax=Pseudogracilibacillus auburnensis TaxID=1494959 RepID=UPI001A95CBF4|nr:tail assembly chaperone [Pseudogracilibacillus auburnensis]MBO1002672.1 hypothetical protein [Pseudogracilibacillus auburnensis]
MKLTIGGNEYELDFGLDFIATLDEIYTAKADGMEFGLGVEHSISYIKMKNPTVLVRLIKAGTSHFKSKPSNDDIKAFLTEKAENDELDDLFDEFEENMRIAPFLKGKLKGIVDNL